MKKQNFIITSLFLFWVIGTTTAQTITGKVTNIHAQAIDGATVILQTIDSTFVDDEYASHPENAFFFRL